MPLWTSFSKTRNQSAIIIKGLIIKGIHIKPYRVTSERVKSPHRVNDDDRLRRGKNSSDTVNDEKLHSIYGFDCTLFFGSKYVTESLLRVPESQRIALEKTSGDLKTL